MSFIQAITQRLIDWNLELRIADHCWLAKACEAIGLKSGARHHFVEMAVLITQRSKQQIERMERAAGIFR